MMKLCTLAIIVSIFFILSCGSAEIELGTENRGVSESGIEADSETGSSNETSDGQSGDSGSSSTNESNNGDFLQKGNVSITSSYNHKPDIFEDPEHPWFPVISVRSAIGVLMSDEEGDALSCEWKVNGELRQSDCNLFTINNTGAITILFTATDAKGLSENLEKTILVQ